MLKSIFKKIVIAAITLEAKLILKRHKPKIIAITGSVGKTSTKDAINAVMSPKFEVRRSKKSYNSEIGAPLTILDEESGWSNPLRWISIILKGIYLTLFSSKYPEFLILEIGVEKPKDMDSLLSWIKPHVAVITALAEIPVHVEFFSGPEAVAKEKSKILKNLEVDNLAVLNSDDDAVFSMKDRSRAKIISYGFGEGADIVASGYKIIYKEGDQNKIIPEGITFKVDSEGGSVPVRLFNVFGKHHVYPILAAFAVGKSFGLNLVEMSEAFSSYESPAGRLKLIEGEKGSFVLDDTYNASPMAMRAALETLADIPAKRKIVVLGDMLQLGKYAIESHKAMAEYILKSGAKIVFSIGPRMKFMAETLRENNFIAKNIFEFPDSSAAKKKVEEIIEEGDLILVKGSQSMRMEKIVEEIIARPERRKELLVRQEKEWLNR
ncbi:MAG: UDP-N-acetylmuramoyl-tripeptide--D-alanyl-D-alanine ligase [Candidatus Pacebacteria bacterium]|nr:UDP-N-acetylmuramoyl-tripeptide--D-alanyl-D-alanine ligase [Candidatus Paceibacterota bacterium]